MADTRHGYFASLLEGAIATLVSSCVVLVARALRARGDRLVCETPSLPVLWMLLATLQVVGFATLEYAEGNAPDVVGFGVQIMVALIVAVAVVAFLGFVERCVIAVAMTYLRRARGKSKALRLPAATVQTSLQLATRVGIHRFKRPPPIIG